MGIWGVDYQEKVTKPQNPDCNFSKFAPRGPRYTRGFLLGCQNFDSVLGLQHSAAVDI